MNNLQLCAKTLFSCRRCGIILRKDYNGAGYTTVRCAALFFSIIKSTTQMEEHYWDELKAMDKIIALCEQIDDEEKFI